MKISIENNYSIISLPDEVLGGEQVMEFSSLVDDSLDENVSYIIVDMSGVKVMNSSGLGMLVGAHTSCSKQDSKLIIASPNSKILELFEITKLSRVLNVVDGLEKAKEIAE